MINIIRLLMGRDLGAVADGGVCGQGQVRGT